MSLFVSSPTTPHASKSARIRSRSRGSREQLHRRLALGRRQSHLLRLRLEGLADPLLLLLLEGQEDLAQVPLDRVLARPELDRGLLHEGRTLPRRVEVERVHVQPLLARGEEVHPQAVVGEVLREATDAVPPVPEGERHLVRRRIRRCFFLSSYGS